MQKGQSRPLRKTHQFEREHVYTDEDGNLLHLVGVNGTGDMKEVKQYHWDNDGWFTGAAKRKVPYNLPSVIEAVASNKIVFVTEGEKDTDTLINADLVATTNPNGAGSWPTDPGFNQFFRGADVVILPDNDEPGREHVNKVAATLEPYAKRIRILSIPGLPNKGDVTDWVRAGGDTAALETMAQEDGVVVKDETKQSQAAPLFPPALEPAALGLAPSASAVSKNVVGADSSRFFDSNGHFQPVVLGEEVLRVLPAVHYKSVVYVYCDGVYVPNGEFVIKQYCQRALGRRSRSTYLEEVLKWIKVERHLDGDVANPDDGLINVQNGLLDWRTGTLFSHTPERFGTIRVPVVYDPTAPTDVVERFIQDVVPSDTVDFVHEMAGYCLVPTTKYQVAFMLTGGGSNGKSTFLDLLSALVGEANISNVPLHELETHRFKLALLRDRLVNMFADLEYSALEKSSVFKAVVTGDRVNAEFKGRDPFDFRPFSRLVFSANELPGTRDISNGFFRRWKVIPFPYRFGNDPGAKPVDPNLAKRLTSPENLSGFLNLALQGLRRLETRQRFEDTKSTSAALEAYRRDADSVASFMGERCVVGTFEEIGTTPMYGEYEIWCRESGVKAVKKIRFFKRIEELAPNAKRKRRHAGAEYYDGIGLRA